MNFSRYINTILAETSNSPRQETIFHRKYISQNCKKLLKTE